MALHCLLPFLYCHFQIVVSWSFLRTNALPFLQWPHPHQSSKSLGPDFQSLMRGFAKWKASGEDCAPSSPSSLSSCVLVGTWQSCNSECTNMPMDARNNAAPAPSSCFAEVEESPAPETDCQNRFWSIAGNGQHPIFLRSLTTYKGRYRMATLAKAIL